MDEYLETCRRVELVYLEYSMGHSVRQRNMSVTSPPRTGLNSLLSRLIGIVTLNRLIDTCVSIAQASG